MSNQHVLKIHPAPLADLLSGAKTAEVRRNDRGFQVGDTVRLMEVNPETGNWTGAADHVRTISHIQTGYGLPDGLCVLSYAQPAGGEPVGKVELFGINMTYVEWRDRKMPPLGTELYAAPLAAAHGDEAEPSVDFAAWLIDHREGQLVTEEDMHEWLGEWYENRLAKRGQLDGD